MLTIDTAAIGKALLEIIDKKEASEKLTNEQERKEAANNIRNLRSKFLEQHGEQLRSILEEVYDDLSPDSSVNPPLDYLANHYKLIGTNEKGNVYDVNHQEGVPIDTDEYGENPTKLVILPNPLRVILNIDAHTREEVWSVNF